MKRVTKFGWIVVGLLMAAFPFSASPALAEYPDKPITIYCGYGPGASTDVSSRALATGLEKIFGVPVVVENKPRRRDSRYAPASWPARSRTVTAWG